MITVVSYPVINVGENVLPGKSPVNIEFLRKDLNITSTVIGSDSTVLINVPTDLTTKLNIGEYIYLSSGIYEVYSEVLEVSPTTVRINTQWLGAGSTGGYINYKQNWYIELDLIAPTNEAIHLLPFTLKDNGANNGEIIIDLSIVNDLNYIDIPDFTTLSEIIEQRQKFDIKYREVSTEGVGAYTRITNPIILIPAKESNTVEVFNNGFSEPEYYVGYPNGAVFIHSDTAPAFGDNINFYYSELDINKNYVRENTKIGVLTSNAVYGKIFVPMVNLDLLETTEYITLKAESANIPEYNPLEYSNEYNII